MIVYSVLIKSSVGEEVDFSLAVGKAPDRESVEALDAVLGLDTR